MSYTHIKVPLFSPNEIKEMEQYLQSLEKAAAREIEASPENRSEIIRHYQELADKYIRERKFKKHKVNYTAALWTTGLGLACVVLSFPLEISVLGLIGIALFFAGIGTAIQHKVVMGSATSGANVRDRSPHMPANPTPPVPPIAPIESIIPAAITSDAMSNIPSACLSRAVSEVEQGVLDANQWSKFLAQNRNDVIRTEANYLTYRCQALQKEVETAIQDKIQTFRRDIRAAFKSRAWSRAGSVLKEYEAFVGNLELEFIDFKNRLPALCVLSNITGQLSEVDRLINEASFNQAHSISVSLPAFPVPYSPEDQQEIQSAQNKREHVIGRLGTAWVNALTRRLQHCKYRLPLASAIMGELELLPIANDMREHLGKTWAARIVEAEAAACEWKRVRLIITAVVLVVIIIVSACLYYPYWLRAKALDATIRDFDSAVASSNHLLACLYASEISQQYYPAKYYITKNETDARKQKYRTELSEKCNEMLRTAASNLAHCGSSSSAVDVAQLDASVKDVEQFRSSSRFNLLQEEHLKLSASSMLLSKAAAAIEYGQLLKRIGATAAEAQETSLAYSQAQGMLDSAMYDIKQFRLTGRLVWLTESERNHLRRLEEDISMQKSQIKEWPKIILKRIAQNENDKFVAVVDILATYQGLSAFIKKDLAVRPDEIISVPWNSCTFKWKVDSIVTNGISIRKLCVMPKP